MTRRTHTKDVDKLIELLDDLVEHPVGPGDDNGEEGLVLVEPHGERLDVVASPGEDPGDAVDHAAFVPDEHRNRVAPHPAFDARNPSRLIHQKKKIETDKSGACTTKTTRVPRARERD